jgi:hypothetical protein
MTKEKEMSDRKYDYKVHEVDAKASVEKILNRYGRKGYKMVEIVPFSKIVDTYGEDQTPLSRPMVRIVLERVYFDEKELG